MLIFIVLKNSIICSYLEMFYIKSVCISVFYVSLPLTN